METACGFCVGNHFSPKSGGVSVRTSNRNFEGRSGTKDAQVYLASPEAAAVAAVTGQSGRPARIRHGISEDRGAGRIPDRRLACSSFPRRRWRTRPSSAGRTSASRPKNSAMPQDLDGDVVIKVGDRITTDHIIPAGERLKYRSNVPKYARVRLRARGPRLSASAAWKTRPRACTT